MAALILLVSLALAITYWLMSPLTALLRPLSELHGLPWLLALGGVWLLAGRAPGNR